MTDTAPATFRLIYWPRLPGRGEYVRLVLEEAGEPYVDTARLPADQGGGVAAVRAVLDGPHSPPPFAPPILEHGGVFISQTANICTYLGQALGLDPPGTLERALILQLHLTAADVAAEAHDTHHPIATGLYYEEQRDAAVEAARHFCAHRIPKFLGYFHRVLTAGRGPWLLTEFTTADLAVFHTLVGLGHAFPRTMAAALAGLPELADHRDRVAARPRIAAYLASDRRTPFTEHGIFRAYPELDIPGGV